ncbi:MAG: ParB N-terminal domain-containing protein [Prevotella sp.]|jgi:hypothetical protein|nr:ParB N-terminal domain-containing protein [Prevotella sp.]
MDKDTIIHELIDEICRLIEDEENMDKKIDLLNYTRAQLHNVSPLKHHPVDFVAWEKSKNVEGNDYNPNSVAPPEMKLLITSIEEDGYTMPIVTCPEKDMIYIVDGYHRRQSEKKSVCISKSTMGRLPITFIREKQRGLNDRMASTIRHNRARGSHDIDLMSNIVKELTLTGKSPAWIAKQIGMDMDEIVRLKQLTGIAALFENEEFSMNYDR